MKLEFIQNLVKPADSKIVLLVLDGLGGLPSGPQGRTELEAANTPNLDELARRGICGLHVPVGPGITPGSGPGHLGLFGYDPTEYKVGRGVLSALGVEFDLQHGDVAARGNFCTVDDEGLVTDRRAGRISTEKNEELCELLREIEVEGAEIHIETVKEHRMLFVLRGEGLSDEINDTDPQETGKKPEEPVPATEAAQKTSRLVKEFLNQAAEKLADHAPANMLLLRGFAQRPGWPTFQEAFGLRSAAIASYPMYRGVAKLLGMDTLEGPASIEEKAAVAREHWDDYDFFFIHKKSVDSRGEDGDFEAKVRAIEEADAQLQALLDLEPDVVIVTGDHSTPAQLAYHSWHPVPVLLWSEQCRTDGVETFGERDCLRGGLGARLPAVDLMPLALANALRLDKFGA
ncbi:2,3-bisphosphoglycerate-independent phosphoglycerate mutase [Persicimonas caeni]|uniref:2,3-bisphosphoglycerate-independent phosphoglycerate mutase n=1 Tax=Persicimonas caeni TaxID=2292766 RepID=A0A4Y6Q2C9_PERCE|nr:2,3-bisphosphoglycerate-independent phosphoglycerate mutase [Persicimonas caeni]QDG54741.1 2,3-bisphosphoglycerate-independent phosphoglycerate mutase [Persicimonas caeni]QED35962.1 2,3-bisphosphoglycerate-independent phosphoglycerate mutase [Persicimonas caeni]